MRKILSVVLLSAVGFICRGETTNGMIRCVADLSKLADSPAAIGRRFLFKATVLYPCSRQSSSISLEDETGVIAITCEPGDWRGNFQSGDVLLATGTIQTNEQDFIFAEMSMNTRRIGKTEPKPLVDATAEDLLSGRFDGYPVRVSCVIRDVFNDEIDPLYLYAIINCDNHVFYAGLHNDGSLRNPRELIGARVVFEGIWSQPLVPGGRRHLGKILSPCKLLTVSPPVNNDGFDVPPLSSAGRFQPAEIASLGRHSVSGRVLAVWHHDTALLRTANGKIVRIEFASSPPPTCGTHIQAVGFPECDLFHLNLTRAIWRSCGLADDPKDPPQRRSAESLQRNIGGLLRFDYAAHGKTILLRGIVRNLPGDGNDDGRFTLESGKLIVPVDISMFPEIRERLAIGCEIEVAGTCVMDSDNWRVNSVFPQIRGISIIVRKPDDIIVISRPSWWTEDRLLLVIGILLAGLCVILIWNAALRKLAARKGHELMREQIGHVTAELKTEERTRLAVELHDSLAQNLTGVSLEIDTAAKVADENPTAMKEHLSVAARSLKSCRDELRNCLWDLRNRALEERTMDEAIRQTLAPHVAGIGLAIRFNVPRERISDNTAHAILRIIRELTLNGIRHGGATRIRIAGSVEGDRMLFSVRDNGCGFDPDTAPGFSEGHYGLVGIRERVDEFEGEFELVSAPGKGTKATVSLRVPQENQQA